MFRERPRGWEWPLGLPHHPGGVAGSLYRGEKRLHGNQVQFPSAPGRHSEGGDPRWLHPWGKPGKSLAAIEFY